MFDFHRDKNVHGARDHESKTDTFLTNMTYKEKCFLDSAKMVNLWMVSEARKMKIIKDIYII